jgi:L-alanine-DL-glutamate epimerase-like enolase superfamily enzyme
MKITKIEVYGFGFREKMPSTPIGCRVLTDEGIFGDGEAALAYGTGAHAAFGMIRDLAKLVIGMDPIDNEVIWDKMHKETFWGMAGGPVVFAGISAIDMALWDIRAKTFGVPLYKLLGGKRNPDLRCYASQIQSGFSKHPGILTKPEEYAEIASYCVKELGYDAVKIDFLCFDENGRLFNRDKKRCKLDNRTLKTAVSRVEAVRKAVGDDVDIIIENHSNLDAMSAIQFARAAEPYNFFFFEEPNTPAVITSKYICENINIPVANGERIFSRWQYMPYFEASALQVAQPDIGTCGGFTEAKKICDIAHTYDVAVQAHACGSPLSSVAAVQLETALPNFIIHEHHLCFLQDFNIAICKYDYQPVNGRISAPDVPGIGNEWSDEAIAAAVKETVDSGVGF